MQARCLREYWIPLSGAYIGSHPKVMNEPLRVASINCMRKKGYTMTGEEQSYGDMAGNEAKQQDDAAQCASSAAHRLYPNLTGLDLVG